ncbi:peptidase metallopeptidase [Methylobacterium sp. 4-46]|uniref:Hint domain-containing protein n=1 Tax=unclassified Methylobacterium TaxID=2615210 RepID=UPI000152EA58|nr:Hint domain-containing protein [Methylobacterium nodulans]ACA21019.1 peptidase metallopeptidase [Methylobacterium sp. 4-46]WFT80170.1 Hint domain-containing protein [Methylobacterium nodulans]
MDDLTSAQEDEITFISGVDRSGAVANNTYFTYNVEGYNFNPPRAYISKWYNDDKGSPIAATSKAGTPGGVVSYAFDSSVGVEAQAAYKAALTLWSDIADIKFQEVAWSAAASIQISNTPEANGDTFVPSNGYSVPGRGVTDLPTQMAPHTRGGAVQINVSADDAAFKISSIGAPSQIGTVVHETGHALGLGHAGRYNGSYDASGQFSAYDTQSWSIMSYIDPQDSAAPYFDKYPVQGTQWTSYYKGAEFKGGAQSPMMLDILASQRLYGASKSSTFSGGQVYGFNSNISDASRLLFDFSVNRVPIVTLYNSGTNNTLDLSGFDTPSTINLNPGSFSSASASGLLVNNIGIAYNTRIDKAVGGAGDDTFILNGDGDTIDGGGGTNRVVIKGDRANYSVERTGAASATVTNTATGAIDRLTNVQDITFDPPVCFATGTRIAVVRDGVEAAVAVEDLRVGDAAVTASGRARPIVWIGHRELAGPLSPDQHPVRVRAGAFGAGLPARDLLLSPGHPVLVGAGADGEGGVLVPVMCLINGTSIAREPAARVTYWHVELDAHDLLLAEGLAAESYLDLGSRPWFEEGSASALHDPDLVPAGVPGRCRPVATRGPAVEAERRRLDAVFAARLSAQCAWPEADAVALPG